MKRFFRRLKTLVAQTSSRGAQRATRPRPGQYRPCLESFEDRLALSSLTLSGSITMQAGSAVGADLASTAGHTNAWTATMHDIVEVPYLADSGDRGYYAATLASSNSFDLTFTGPDAALLNDVVADEMAGGSATLDVIRAYSSGICDWYFTVSPIDSEAGITLQAIGYQLFPDDGYGYPVIDSMNLPDATTYLFDHRPGNDGAMISSGDLVRLVRDGDEPPIAIAIADASVAEEASGAPNAVFAVSLSTSSTQPVTVHFATADESATDGGDYTGVSGTLTFAPGETIQTITVPINDDTRDELDETFFVLLSTPTNAVLVDSTGVGTIVDDDPPPSITISDVSRVEGRSRVSYFVLTVNLSAPSEKTITVNYGTADGTAKVSDKDYVAAAGTLTFAPGETTKTITVEVRGDNRREANETFFLNLSAADNGSLLDGQALGTILNDD